MTRIHPATDPREALSHAAVLGRSETIASVSLPVPVLDAAGIARAFGDDLRMSWRDRDARLSAAVGTTAAIHVRGSSRFAAARAAARSLYARIAGRKPRLLGGFSFEPGCADSDSWAGFGDGRFELARALYETDGNTAELSVQLENPLDPRRRRDALRELASRAESITRVADAGLAKTRSEPSVTAAVPLRARAHYLDMVARARDLCRGGETAKIVVARSAVIDLAEPIELCELLATLDDAYGDCYLLTVSGDAPAGRRPNVLVAASPERLVRVQGASIETSALAGTVPIDRAGDLLSDAKLQHEHQLTADAIASALASSGCTEVEVSPPALRPLRNLVHLETPIRASRRPGAHIFEIAGALHPTPAVAGIPLEAACRFLRDNETEPRGWYAGLVGWCDASGDGELAVALRAGLLGDETIRLYAGAGIVGDSDPETEWAETTLKIAALGSHLLGPRR